MVGIVVSSFCDEENKLCRFLFGFFISGFIFILTLFCVYDILYLTAKALGRSIVTRLSSRLLQFTIRLHST